MQNETFVQRSVLHVATA